MAGQTVLMVRPPEGADYELRDQETLVELFRSSEPYGVPGTKVQIGRRGSELTTRLLPNPIRSADGVLNVFTTDNQGGEAEHVDPYTVLVLVEARVACSHPVDIWRRFTAKVGIAATHVLARSDVGPFVLPVSPDRLHKDNVSGGPPYGIVVPDGCADGIFAAEAAMPFVSYLNWVFSSGGFPGCSASPAPWALRQSLAKDLLPL